MPRLDEIIGFSSLASEGEAGVLKRLGGRHAASGGHRPARRGPGDRALSRAAGVAFKWWAIAGDNLTKVVAFEVYRRADPQSFTKAS